MIDLKKSKIARDKNHFYLSLVIYLNIFIIGFILLIIYWSVYPYRVLEIKGSKFPILNTNKTIKQGDILYFVSDNCKYMNITSHTSRIFMNGLSFYIPQTTTNVRKGCGKLTIAVFVPNEMPIGKYYLHNIFEYKVNLIRTIIVEHDTEWFTIIK